MNEHENEEKKRFIDYLYSHIEWEHIVADSYEYYQTEVLENLSLGQLQRLARLYDYNK